MRDFQHRMILSILYLYHYENSLNARKIQRITWRIYEKNAHPWPWNSTFM